MEDVLDLYAEPYNPKRPKVNFEESNKPLIHEKRQRWPSAPGHPERHDDESQGNGTRSRCMFCEPQAGWRHGAVTEQRPKLDCAHQRQWLVDEQYPEAAVIRLVMDQLNPHKVASLYDALAPEEARRLARKLESHYTPKHGRWLNRAEIELSILPRQCLDRRLPDEATLTDEVVVWEVRRNQEQAPSDWRFSGTDAREKLKRLYPSLSS
jgi:hypothetical protein